MRCTLLRLTKEDFIQLIHEPLINRINRAEAEDRVTRGARWLDVRLAEEHQADGIAGSVNIPFGDIRARIEELDASTSYVVYCNSGRRSSAAAFLLTQRGLSTSVLGEGLFGETERPTDKAPTPPSAGLEAQLLLANAEFEAALRNKAQADAARATEAAPGQGGTEDAEARLHERQERLESESARASEALAAAQKRKLELEARMRAAEAEGAALRERTETTIQRMRKEAESRLREEEKRLKGEYAQAASQMKRIEDTRREAEARFEEERRRLEELFAQTRDEMESQVQRIRGDMEAAKRDTECKADEIRSEHLARERLVREESENRLRSERKRLESEFALSVAEQEKAKHDLELADTAKRAAQREAQRFAAELEEAEQRRRAEEDKRRAQEKQRLQRDSEEAAKQLEEARKEKEDLSSTIIRIREAVKPHEKAAREEKQAELESVEARIAGADERIGAAERANTQARRAQQQVEERLARQRAAEEELRLQLFDDVEGWLEEEKSRSEEELERLRRIDEGLERIQAEKAKAQREAERDAADMMADIGAQLGDEESLRTFAEHHATLTREAQQDIATERARAKDALERARQQIEALKELT